jgi:phospholipase C
MFQTNQGPSYPAHQYIFGATSAASLEDDHAGKFTSENPYGTAGATGCTAGSNVSVQLIDPYGVEDRSNVMFPCFEHNTVSDLLESAGVTWRYYAPGPGGIWTAPNSIDHICQASGWKCTGADFANVDTTSADVLTDIAGCKLKQVSWVIPIGDNSDHARDTTGGGPSWVASIVNAIGNSWTNSKHKCDYWGDNTSDATAILVTWDDWGGWYDHEPPAVLAWPQGGYQNGFRVPLLVISAYTSPRYVDNNRHDFGSIIRFIEQNYGIEEGALTFADARATTDLKTFFKLGHPARIFRTIAAPMHADYFINDTRPQTAPDDD